MHRNIHSLLFIVLLGVVVPIGAFAQSEDAVRKAEALAQSAMVMLDDGKVEEAIDLFRKAYELDPAPGLAYNIGRLLERQGDLAQARVFYQRFLDTETDSVRLKKGSERLEEVLDRLPGRLTITAEPTGVRVRLDGVDLGPADGRTYEVKRGTHRLVLSLNAHRDFETDIVIVADADHPIKARLEPSQSPEPEPVPKPQASSVAAAPTSTPTRAVSAKSASTERVVRVPVTLSFSEGFAHYDGDTYRTNVGMGLDLGLRFRGAKWLVPSLGLWWTLEKPTNVTLRPGIQWYFGSFPMYVRTALTAMVTSPSAAGFVAGLGGDIPLWKNGFLALEMTTTVWSKKVVPVDLRLGIGHAF